MQMHIFVHTQHAPGINEMNIGQKTRLVAVCNYLAFHFPLPLPPPPLTAYYQRASLPPSPPIPSLSVSEQEHRLILHSHFIFFLLSNVDEQPGGHYPGAEGITGVWLQVKKW